MKTDGRVGLGRHLAFLVDRPGRDCVRSGDQVDRFLAKSAPPLLDRIRSCPTSSSCTPVTTRVRFGALERTMPGSSLIFAGLSVVAAVVILYYLFRAGGCVDRVLTVALGLIMAGAMGNCYDRLGIRLRPRLRSLPRRCDRLRLRDFQLRRQHVDRRGDHAGPLRMRPEKSPVTSQRGFLGSVLHFVPISSVGLRPADQQCARLLARRGTALQPSSIMCSHTS